jgi:hypothetical protein
LLFGRESWSLGLLLHLGKRKHLVGMFYWCALRQQGDEEEADETP